MVKILGVDRGIARVQVGSLQQALDDQCHVAAKFLLNLFLSNHLFHDGAIEQQRDDGSTFQPDLCGGDQGRFDVTQQAVNAVLVSAIAIKGNYPFHQLLHFGDIFPL